MACGNKSGQSVGTGGKPGTGGISTGGAAGGSSSQGGSSSGGIWGTGGKGGQAGGAGGTLANSGGSGAGGVGTTGSGGKSGPSGGALAGGGGTTKPNKDGGPADASGGNGGAVDVAADASPACGADKFKDWDAGKTPTEIALLLAKLFEGQPPDTTKHYKTACTWYGALFVAGLLKETDLETKLIKKFTQFVPNFVAEQTAEKKVDDNVFGIVPLEIYLHNGDIPTRDLGIALADHQIANAAAEKRYVTDDMFMITGLQVQAYRAMKKAGDKKKDDYLNFAAATMVEYLDKIGQKDDGCFFQQSGANAKWGRGNGWFASGMAELLRELDPGHDKYKTILNAYTKMMKGLLNYQIKNSKDGKDDGLWNQVIDVTDAKNWAETSGSAMFAYAMITGVKLCILDAETYGNAARAAWKALTARLDDKGNLKDISDWCYWDSSKGDAFTYYITMDGRSKVTGDGHGQAPMLWSAAALLR
jgi:hypothetical protein